MRPHTLVDFSVWYINAASRHNLNHPTPVQPFDKAFTWFSTSTTLEIYPALSDFGSPILSAASRSPRHLPLGSSFRSSLL